MRNIKLVIEYDGTNYDGWQTQKSKNTIQDTIEEALKKVMNEEIKLIGASRTDSGVHALGQVANFKTNSIIPIERIPKAVNSILPPDIVIKNAQEVQEGFHARFSSKGKKYKYTVLNDVTPSALNRNFAYFYPYKIDIDAIKAASSYFIGTHDFSAFKSSGGVSKTNIRTIYELKIILNDNYINFYISGDGFLYNMVRIIIGTLLEVGRGKINPDEIKEIILSGDRKRAGKTVPAHGLCLLEVYY